MPKRKVLTLTDRAAALLPRLAKKYHDQGAFVSRLIEEAAAQQDAPPTVIDRLNELQRELDRLRADVQPGD